MATSAIIDLGMAPIADDHARARAEKSEGGPGPASKAKNCAECRRMKLKCSRTIPCQNCIRRGCASLCPDGSLVSKGNRLILANTEDLHARIETLSSRIRDLESALSSLHAKHSDEPHPLLTRDQLLTGTIRKEEEDPHEVPVTSFGSLMLGGDGTSKFFGATSGAEWTVPLEDDTPEEGYACVPVSVTNALANQIQGSQGGITGGSHGVPTSLSNPFGTVANLDVISQSFPHSVDRSMLDIPALKRLVIQELPPREKAISLINLYYARVAWEFDPVPRKRLIEEVFGPCYDNLQNPPISGHAMALLYAVFGLGMFHNPEQSNYGALAHQFIVLSRACLATECIYVHTSITAIDALILHIQYFDMSDDPGGGAKAWAALGTTLKLAQSIGLHREPSMWNLSKEEIQRRRRTMWELVAYDLWFSLHFGRPPMISRQHFDVELPMDAPELEVADTNFHRGKHYFTQVCLWPVLDLSLGVKGTYAAVLKMDKRLRDWVLPVHMQANVCAPPDDSQTGLIFQRTLMFIAREITLMCLHRPYFACALLEPPFDPLRSKYSRSVLAAYASACAILNRIRTLYAREPIIIVRFSIFWTHSFSAAMTLGAIASRAPDSPLASTALVEFDHAVEMFDRAKHGYRAGRLLPVLQELKVKAHAAVDSYRNGTWQRPSGKDAGLFPGLGGAKAELYHTRQQRDRGVSKSPSNGPSPPSIDDVEGAGIMSSLGTVKVNTLDAYFQSFGQPSPAASTAPGLSIDTGNQSSPATSSSIYQIPMEVPSSDAFLHGVLTGDWGGMKPLDSAPGNPYDLLQVPPQQYNYNTSVSPQYYATPPLGPQGLQGQQNFTTLGHSPFSDPGSSDSGNSLSGSTPGMLNYDTRPALLQALAEPQIGSTAYGPSFTLQGFAESQQQQTALSGASGGEAATILWEDFLRDLGTGFNAR